MPGRHALAPRRIGHIIGYDGVGDGLQRSIIPDDFDIVANRLETAGANDRDAAGNGHDADNRAMLAATFEELQR